MATKRLKQLENQIQKIKDELQQIGEMRPGSLTLQYKSPKEKKGPYYQLSYTHKMRSRTQYVRAEFVDEIRQQIDVYKRFRNLIEKWIDLAIEHCQMKMNQTIRSKGGRKK
jgi:Mg2+ and Co2+ transporter CorA